MIQKKEKWLHFSFFVDKHVKPWYTIDVDKICVFIIRKDGSIC